MFNQQTLQSHNVGEGVQESRDREKKKIESHEVKKLVSFINKSLTTDPAAKAENAAAVDSADQRLGCSLQQFVV